MFEAGQPPEPLQCLKLKLKLKLAKLQRRSAGQHCPPDQEKESGPRGIPDLSGEQLAGEQPPRHPGHQEGETLVEVGGAERLEEHPRLDRLESSGRVGWIVAISEGSLAEESLLLSSI